MLPPPLGRPVAPPSLLSALLLGDDPSSSSSRAWLFFGLLASFPFLTILRSPIRPRVHQFFPNVKQNNRNQGKAGTVLLKAVFSNLGKRAPEHKRRHRKLITLAVSGLTVWLGKGMREVYAPMSHADRRWDKLSASDKAKRCPTSWWLISLSFYTCSNNSDGLVLERFRGVGTRVTQEAPGAGLRVRNL